MAVITLTQELGSLGTEIAVGLAKRFALKHLPYRVATETGPSAALADKLLRQVIDAHAARRHGPQPDHALDQGRAMAELDIIERAIEGRVILDGIGAGLLLQAVPNVVSVRVCAPLALRTDRIMCRIATTGRAAAESAIAASDVAAAHLAMHLYGADWTSPYLYDVVLNTARLDVAECIDQVSGLIAGQRAAPTVAARLALDDLHLEARARAAARFARLHHLCPVSEASRSTT